MEVKSQKNEQFDKNMKIFTKTEKTVKICWKIINFDAQKLIPQKSDRIRSQLFTETKYQSKKIFLTITPGNAKK